MRKTKLKKYSLSGIKAWPKDDRPREKLLRNGEHTLSGNFVADGGKRPECY